jgi:hypothetical protein
MLPLLSLVLNEEGGSTSQGTVLLNGFPVCDDAWDQAAADVVCHMLNFSGADAATHRGHFGVAEKPFIASHLVCTGEERSLEVGGCPDPLT